jgi:hypothetical protein
LGKVVKLEARQRTPSALCTRLQSGQGRAKEDSPLTPAMMEFVRNVLAPILEKEYFAPNSENELAEKDSDAAHFVSSTATRKLRAVRP